MTRSRISLLPDPTPASLDILNGPLSSLQPELRKVVAPVLNSQAESGACIDTASKAIFVGARKAKGLGGFDIVLFPRCSIEQVRSYSESVQIALPEICIEYLLQFNGGRFFQLTLFGLDDRVVFPYPSGSKPRWHPSDLTSKRTILKRLSALSHGKEGHFVFAERNSAPEELLSYALEYPTFTKIIAISRNNEVVARWDSFISFFTSELKAAVAFDAEWCAGMSQIIAATKRKTKNVG